MSSVHPNIHSEITWWLECTHCGFDSYAGNIPRFASEDEMWHRMLSPHEYGWSRRDDGRILCAWHTATAECDIQDHDITEWAEHPLDEEMVWRYCRRCGSCLEQLVLRIDRPNDRLSGSSDQ